MARGKPPPLGNTGDYRRYTIGKNVRYQNIHYSGVTISRNQFLKLQRGGLTKEQYGKLTATQQVKARKGNVKARKDATVREALLDRYMFYFEVEHGKTISEKAAKRTTEYKELVKDYKAAKKNDDHKALRDLLEKYHLPERWEFHGPGDTP